MTKSCMLYSQSTQPTALICGPKYKLRKQPLWHEQQQYSIPLSLNEHNPTLSKEPFET